MEDQTLFVSPPNQTSSVAKHRQHDYVLNSLGYGGTCGLSTFQEITIQLAQNKTTGNKQTRKGYSKQMRLSVATCVVFAIIALVGSSISVHAQERQQQQQMLSHPTMGMRSGPRLLRGWYRHLMTIFFNINNFIITANSSENFGPGIFCWSFNALQKSVVLIDVDPVHVFRRPNDCNLDC